MLGTFNEGEINRHELMTREEFLRVVEARSQSDGGIGIAADWDGNISYGGKRTGGLDPRDSVMDETARKAMSDMVAAGIPSVILTSRGARDVARLARIPGLYIIGTKGWETFVADKDDPTKGESLIHPQFLPFREQIAGILGSIRTRLLEAEGMLPEVTAEPNVEINTSHGAIVLQRKGDNEDYPEGINLTFVLNQLPLEEQAQYKDRLIRYYQEAFGNYTHGLDVKQKATLEKLCGLTEKSGMAGDRPTLDVEFGPRAQNAKGNAILQLLRKQDDPKRLANFRHMPHATTWIYSGDDIKQDVAAMHAGHRLSTFSKTEGGTLSVLTKPVDQIPAGVDLMVDGVAKNAELLKDISDKVVQK